MKVNKYFDEEEESSSEQVKRVKLRSMNKVDYSGKRFNEWLIVQAVDHKENIYKVVCSCGKESIRNVCAIVNYQVNQCRFCYKKKAYFNLL